MDNCTVDFRAISASDKLSVMEELFGVHENKENGIHDGDIDVLMVSGSFSEMKRRGLMKDSFHYYQMAYNEVGREAGKNAGEYIKIV